MPRPELHTSRSEPEGDQVVNNQDAMDAMEIVAVTVEMLLGRFWLGYQFNHWLPRDIRCILLFGLKYTPNTAPLALSVLICLCCNV